MKQSNYSHTLPENFVIERNESNPLWRDYINWLNKKTNGVKWDGDTFKYYGYNKSKSSDRIFGGTSCSNNISGFKDNTVEISLEFWDKIVNKEEEKPLTELPKYFIIERDDSNPLWQKYIKWLNKTYHANWDGNAYTYYGYNDYGYGEYDESDGTICGDDLDFKNNPELITLNQWNKVVNQFYSKQITKDELTELPKYFVIKRDLSNPLWQKYIDWLNETYGSRWKGKQFLYYGNDGNIFYNGTAFYNKISSFENNPELLTLEEWYSFLNITNDPFYNKTFSEIHERLSNTTIITTNNKQELDKIKSLLRNDHQYKVINASYIIKIFEDSKKVLVGYKLKDSCKIFEKQAKELCGISENSNWLSEEIYFDLNSGAYINAKNSQILDIWFEPVYKYVRK